MLQALRHGSFRDCLLLLLLFLLKTVFMQCACSSHNVDVQFSITVLETIQETRACLVFHFLRSLLADYHPVYMISSSSWFILRHSESRECCGYLRCEFYLKVLVHLKVFDLYESSSSSYRTVFCISCGMSVLLWCRCPTSAPTFWKPSKRPGSVWFYIFSDFC